MKIAWKLLARWAGITERKNPDYLRLETVARIRPNVKYWVWLGLFLF